MSTDSASSDRDDCVPPLTPGGVGSAGGREGRQVRRRRLTHRTASMDSQGASSGSGGRDSDEPLTGLWSRLLATGRDREGGVDGSSRDEDRGTGCAEEAEDDDSARAPLRDALASLRASASSTLDTLRRHPSIPLASLAALAACLAVGFSLVRHQASAYQARMLDLAVSRASESMEWFSDEFDRALAPLFALAQVVKHDQELCELAKAIGSRGDPDALPGWVDPDDPEKESTLLRDVRGVCDDPGSNERFARVAESVKRDSGLGPALSGLRVAPAGVMCMIHPVINYVDYAHVDPVNPFDASSSSSSDHLAPYYNGTKRLYNDWAWDKPNHIDVLRKTFQVQEANENRVTITGPFKMKSAAGDGTVLTETLFCTHLGVSVPNHTVRMIGETKDDPPETYDSWGFVMGFVNWQLMVDRSQISGRFRDAEMVYMLNRTLEYEDRETGESVTKSDRIAWSQERCVTTVPPESRVEVSKSVNGDDWVLVAGYTCPVRPSWELGATLAVVLASSLIAALVCSTLVKNQQHKNLLYKMMPGRAVRKLNRGQTVVEKYSCVTIFFSDIIGFTSMAGEMRPIEVMNMLNALYVKFDKLCEKHHCYKVETIGDAYMVVGGAPDRCTRAEAAKKVALFALDALHCVKNFRTPNGSRINIRAGIASGAVVAGVVGNVMPRYCLFGDTVNYASRMESSSKRNKIQVCELTKSLLMAAAGQSFELRERRDIKDQTGAYLKGKGWRETWWLSGTSSPTCGCAHKPSKVCDKHDAEIQAAVPLELDLERPGDTTSGPIKAPNKQHWSLLGQDLFDAAHHGLVEVVINLLEYRLLDLESSREGANGILTKGVREELRALVFEILSMYNDVNFHNFKHSCHVTVSMNKLLEITSSTRSEMSIPGWYWSDEMVCFAMVFAALIHDVGHLGMPNKILVDLGHDLAHKYENKSVAESNSIDIATDLLLNGDYPHLRASLFKSQDETNAFIMLIRVAVSSTDIACKDNRGECKELLECAFGLKEGVDQAEIKDLQEYHAFNLSMLNNLDATQLDATLLCQNCAFLQLLVQAADVAHTMQPFEMFIRWNYRLYKEQQALHASYLLPTNPSDNWARNDIGFFDFYVEPLAARLCHLSPSDLDELSMLRKYTKQNRDRLSKYGEQITELMVRGVDLGEDEDKTIESILRVCYSSSERQKPWVPVRNRAA